MTHNTDPDLTGDPSQCAPPRGHTLFMTGP